MRRWHVLAILGAIVVAAWLTPPLLPVADAQPLPPGEPFQCGADNIGATLTLLTGCQAPEPQQRRYITAIVAQSTTATGGQFILRYGNSVRSGGAANCATSTVTLLPSAAGTNVRLAAPANTSPPALIYLPTPIIVPPDKDLCVIGVGTNTTTIDVIGYVKP